MLQWEGSESKQYYLYSIYEIRYHPAMTSLSHLQYLLSSYCHVHEKLIYILKNKLCSEFIWKFICDRNTFLTISDTMSTVALIGSLFSIAPFNFVAIIAMTFTFVDATFILISASLLISVTGCCLTVWTVVYIAFIESPCWLFCSLQNLTKIITLSCDTNDIALSMT